MSRQWIPVLALVSLSSGVACAGSLGSAAGPAYRFGTAADTDSLTVIPGVELACAGGGAESAPGCAVQATPVQTMEIDDSAGPALSEFIGASPNTAELLGLELDAPIAAVLLAPETDWLDAGRGSAANPASPAQPAARGRSLPGPLNSLLLNLEVAPEMAALGVLGFGGIVAAGYVGLRRRNQAKRKAPVARAAKPRPRR